VLFTRPAPFHLLLQQIEDGSERPRVRGFTKLLCVGVERRIWMRKGTNLKFKGGRMCV
jgi:hypothetical protein